MPDRNKTCQWCKEPFFDETKRGLSNFCSKKCRLEKGVATRKAKGSYTPTAKQNKARSEAMKEKYAAGWNPNTPEHCAKMSKLMKSRWESGEMAEKTREACIEKYGTEHWTQSKKGRQHASQLHKGRVHTEEARQNMSKGQAKRVREGRLKCFHGLGGIREDLDQYFRSTWEANFARILNEYNIPWSFETESFALPSGKSYTPDFVIEVDGFKTYVEIKGYVDNDGMEKWQDFVLLMQNKECNCVLVDGKIYKLLKARFSTLPYWETT